MGKVHCTHTIIAIDGPSSSGKSTLAKDLARKLDYLYIDTGAMYRAVAQYCIENDLLPHELTGSIMDSIKIDLLNTSEGMKVQLNNIDVTKKIRSLEVSAIVSDVATQKVVREKLVDLQRDLSKGSSVVMDGRDIGSVVFPCADYKFYVTASLEARTERRHAELIKRQYATSPSYEEVQTNLTTRDRIDSTRAHSPLVHCEDAYLVDNTNLNREEQLEYVLAIIQK